MRRSSRVFVLSSFYDDSSLKGTMVQSAGMRGPRQARRLGVFPNVAIRIMNGLSCALTRGEAGACSQCGLHGLWRRKFCDNVRA